MGSEKLPLSASPSKAEKHIPTELEVGLSDHDCDLVLDQWQAAVGRFHHIVKQSSEFSSPIVFIKNVDGAMPELRHAAMAMVICTQI